MPAEPILIVDDNAANRKLLRLLLEAEGHAVLVAASAAECRAIVAASRPALVFMDIQLPDEDGLTLARALRASPAGRSVPIVAVTAHAMKGVEERARRAGCNAFVAKPIDTRAVAALVERLLGRPEHGLAPAPARPPKGGGECR